MEISGAQRVGDSPARFVTRGPEEGVLRLELLEHLPRVVDRAVVDDDDLVPEGRRRERLGRLLHEERQVLGFVLGWYEHRDIDCRCGERGAACGVGHVLARGRVHTRLRMRAESTPNWSRYLATVRRAIWTPLSFRMLTIAWSVSGCLGFSSATSFSIWALIPRAETSSP